MTSPADQAVVSGTVAVSGTASDARGVTAVRLLVDGTDSGVTVTLSGDAVTTTLDTRGLVNGPHSLALQAEDAAGNLGTSAPVVLSVDNPDVRAPSTPRTLVAAVTATEAPAQLGRRRRRRGRHGIHRAQGRCPAGDDR